MHAPDPSFRHSRESGNPVSALSSVGQKRKRDPRFRGGDGLGLGVLLALFLSLLAAPATAQTFPALTGRVVDQAELLTNAQEATLGARSEALERRTTDQFVIVTIPSLRGQPIDQYAHALGDHWRIGQAGRNNGIVMVVAPTERMVWIAVADGLLAPLPNTETQRIVDEILPAFRESRYFEGIDRASLTITARLAAAGARQSEAR